MRPAQYALGQPIQFFCKFSIQHGSTLDQETQSQLLDTLCMPESMLVLLVRKVRIGRVFGWSLLPTISDGTVAEDISTAVTWPRFTLFDDDTGLTQTRSRTLQGELMVPGGIPPGFTFPSIQTSVRNSLICVVRV